MGYLSEVALVIRSGAVVPDHVQAAINTLFHQPFKSIDQAVLYYHPWVKWYAYDNENCPEVHAISQWFYEVDPDDFLFMRVGEDDGDYDEEGAFSLEPFGVNFVRHITIGGKCAYEELMSC